MIVGTKVRNMILKEEELRYRLDTIKSWRNPDYRILDEAFESHEELRTKLQETTAKYEKLKLNIRRILEFDDKEYEDVIR